MWKVLIADDEVNMREGIKLLIDWHGLNCDIVCAVPNGALALEYCLNEQIDIVLTDIKMPVMDGLGLAKEIYEQRPKIITVIMSAHKSFEYAQKAIAYNVKNYLTKPLEEQELIVCIKRAVAECEHRQSTQSDTQAHYNDILGRILFSNADKANKESLLAQIQDKETTAVNASFAIAQTRFINEHDNLQGETFLHHYFEVNKLGYITKDRNQNIIMLCILKTEENSLHTVFKALRKSMDEQFKDGFFIAVGCSTQSAADLFKSYLQTNNLFLMGLFANSANVLYANDISIGEPPIQPKESWNLDVFINHIKHSQTLEAYEQLNLLRHELLQVTNMERALYGQCDLIFKRFSLIDNDFHYEENLELLSQTKDIDSTFRLVAKNAQLLASRFAHQIGTADNVLVEKVISLVEDNVQNPDLNVMFIASQMNYNSLYISRVFTAIKGISIKKHIQSMRVERACLLLKQTNRSITEISIETGFRDLPTFYETFKKIKNITPKEYRQS